MSLDRLVGESAAAAQGWLGVFAVHGAIDLPGLDQLEDMFRLVGVRDRAFPKVME